MANAAAIAKIHVRFMLPPLTRIGRRGGRLHLRWTQDDLLRAPGGDFRHEQLIRIAAIDFVHGAELPEALTGLAELADDLAVELHLVDLAGDGPRRRRIRIG